jgi:hypothetical protein
MKNAGSSRANCTIPLGNILAATKMAMSTLQVKLPADTALQDCIKLLDDSISETRTIHISCIRRFSMKRD